MPPPRFRSLSLALACSHAGLWPADCEAAEASAKSPKAPPSAGLVNDWLRADHPDATAWDLGGQFRVRYEWKDHAGCFPNRDFLVGLDNSNDYLLLRTRVHLGWTPSPWVTAYTEGRDSHSIGDTRPVTETDVFDLHQAWLRLGDPKAFPVTAKIGRQEMLYGDERYIGIGDWSNFGRSFDAAKLRYEEDGFWVDAFSGRQVLPRDEHFNLSNDYDWFSGLYAGVPPVVDWQATELFVLSRNVADGSPAAITSSLGGPGPRDIVTLGTRWKSIPGKLGPWDYAFEIAGELGSIQLDGRRQDQSALAVNASGGYTWKDTVGTPRAAVGYDFGSGDDDPTDDRNGTVDLLFGTNHRLYGLMDIFGMRNLHIPRAGVSAKPAQDWTVSVEWLGYWMVETADLLYPESGPGRTLNGCGRHPDYSPYVGQELDVLATWRPRPWAQLQAGYGHFFPGDYLHQVASSGGRITEDADWLFLQATFNF